MDFKIGENADLLARIASGDSRAEEELVVRFSRPVLMLLGRRASDRDLAHDLHQDTFCLVLLKARAGRIRKPDKLQAYVFSVANNLLIDHHRKDQRRKTQPDSDMVQQTKDESPGPFDQMERDQFYDELRRTLDDIEVDRDRKLLKQYFLDGIPADRLCNQLGLTIRHFARVKHRALSRFIKLVRSKGILQAH